jgi:hypothetical protein
MVNLFDNSKWNSLKHKIGEHNPSRDEDKGWRWYLKKAQVKDAMRTAIQFGEENDKYGGGRVLATNIALSALVYRQQLLTIELM